MIRFIQKHWVCSIFILIPLFLYAYCYFTDLRYSTDYSDRRWYPISIMEQNTTVIEYKTASLIKYAKCFELGFDLDEFGKRFNRYKEFPMPYNPHTLTDEEFYSQIDGKSYFLIEIYKDGKLERKENIYMIAREGWGYEDIDGKSIALSTVRGYWGPRRAGCYRFLSDSDYLIKITNLIPIDRYDSIKTYLGITPVPIL